MAIDNTDSAAVHEVTCTAPVNIAVIKYWGKRDTALLLPTNSSLSLTLSQDDLRSTTTVRCAPEIAADRLWLNGVEQDPAAPRLRAVLAEARRLRREAERRNPALPPLADWHLVIASNNNFPTAAGLASSASGFACLAFALFRLFGLEERAGLSLGDASRLARIGSGSACRSLFGGFVAWEMGVLPDGADSVAVQVAPQSHWPDIEALIFIVSDARKDTGSTAGMNLTVETSSLFHRRIATIVKERMRRITAAIRDKDFDVFAEITIADSNQFHAVCLDSFPPIFYMNDISRAIVRLITAYNRLFTVPVADATKTDSANPPFDPTANVDIFPRARGYRAAYTYDAGPNAVIYLRREHVPEILALINHFFPPEKTAMASKEATNGYFGHRIASNKFLSGVDPARIADLAKQIAAAGGPTAPYSPGSLHRIISTSIGDGPRLLASGFKPDVSLLNDAGLPK